ncbi:hypothetical protein Cgig2_017149 [Carnegiea gigantea]|uniref:Uncharacterized protein n=1 Tax=Carnegiea gigantea TaxID=171969 RepID=A0A9Q1GL07_9CARY|nr:hypothetical protein Cgig2_017149 [Carnegiea gigantea]
MAREMKDGPVDIEAGGAGTGQFYPNMMENPRFRWGFIRKVYVIIAMQLLLTVGVAAIVVFVEPVATFMVSIPAGLAVYVSIFISTVLVLILLHVFMKRHPINLLLLAFFTCLMAFAIGTSCAYTKGECHHFLLIESAQLFTLSMYWHYDKYGVCLSLIGQVFERKVVLLAAILTVVVVVSLTLYTFWAVRRGQDFSFLGPFLFAGFMMLLVFMLIQIFFPLGRLSRTIYGCLAALLFSAFIVYDTDNLIKRFGYDEYIPAAVSLYLDIVNLFLALLTIFKTE